MGNNIKKLKKEEIRKYYDIKEQLGKGSFATVKRAVRKSDHKHFAVKIIKKNKLNPEELLVVHDEVEIMHKINQQNCVQLYEMFETSKKLYMVLELLTGGELFDRIVAKGSYSELEASQLIRDVLTAINYLHGIGVVHRDLKPENLIYLNEDMKSPVKITDFGLAKYRAGNSARDLMNTACGTPGYVAPEILKSEAYGKEVDLWSVGVILYILLCGFPPFFHEHTDALYNQIKRGEYEFPDPYWSEISFAAKDLVRKLLTVNPRRRLTAEGALRHPWINGNAAPSRKFGGGHTQRLRLLQARRKFRRAVRSIIALNRFVLNVEDITN